MLSITALLLCDTGWLTFARREAEVAPRNDRRDRLLGMLLLWRGCSTQGYSAVLHQAAAAGQGLVPTQHAAIAFCPISVSGNTVGSRYDCMGGCVRGVSVLVNGAGACFSVGSTATAFNAAAEGVKVRFPSKKD